MKRKFYRSEAGNITVVDMAGNNLLIFIDEKSYLVENPSKPVTWNREKIGEVEIKQEDTPEKILNRITENLK
ncbi:MAG: hypothetical protein ABFD50_13750 [Smithella sp.]